MITVLGKLTDTQEYVGRAGYNVLYESSTWTIESNRTWLIEAVHRGDLFLLVSVEGTGQYANELQQLISLLTRAAK